MKKKLIKNLMVVLAVVMLCFVVCVTASAEERAIIDSGECGAQGDNVIWTLYDDGELVISGEGEMMDYGYADESSVGSNYSPWRGYYYHKVIIKDGITSVGNVAFDYAENITTVNLPDSVVRIGDAAFYNCKNLTDITIPKELKEIGNHAFDYCSNLTKVDIPESVTTIGHYAFYNCTNLESIGILDNVESMGNGAFDGTAYFNNPDNWENDVLYIGRHIAKAKDTLSGYYKIKEGTLSVLSYAFGGCNNLTGIEMPDSVVSIGRGAFAWSQNIEEVIFSDSLKSIGENILDGTAYYNNPDNWENDVLYVNKYLMKMKDAFEGEYEVKGGTTIIADSAFYSCKNLTKMDIADSVTAIGKSAFRYCEGLTEVSIPDSVTTIGRYAFEECKNLKAIYIPDGITVIEDYTFGGCENLENIEFGKNVETIKTHAFASCDRLTSVNIPDSVTTIGTCALMDCTNLTSVHLGSGVKTIEEFAFDLSHKLSVITVDVDNQYFSNDDNGVLFNKDKTVLVTYPMGKTEKQYIIPDSVISVGDYAFLFSFRLEDVVIPDNVTEIGMYAFCFCASLEKLTMSETLVDIKEGAFAMCVGVTDVVINDCVENIGMIAFTHMPFLEKIIIKSMDVNLGEFSLCGNEFKVVGLSREEFIYMYTQEFFGNYEYSEKLSEHMIFMEDAPIIIGTIYAHTGSTAEAYANEYGIEFVPTHFFEGDWIYDSENKISYRQCIHCDEREISEEVGEPDTDANKCGDNLYWSFDETTGTLTISGEGSMYDFDEKYIKCPWEDLKLDIKSVIIGDGVTTIGKNAFFLCYNLTKVQLPDSLTTIGCQAFCHCVKLAEIAIPDSVTTIGEAAFQLCFSLKEVVISEYVENIGDLAFTMSPFTEKIIVRSKNAEIGEFALCATPFIGVKDISIEDFIELYIQSQISYDSSLSEEVDSKWVYAENGVAFIGTIYAHTDSSAEAYANEYGIEFVPTHFFEGDWIYDSENKNFYRQCIHCDEREISEEIGDVEIEAPVIPGTDFTVDVVEDYVIIEETISNNVTVDFEIIKAFDINLKNSDGVHVQPGGSVKVKLPNDWSKSGVYKVYRVNDDGTLTDMNAYRQGSHLVFDTDHFSVYVIVVEEEAPTEPEAPAEPESPAEPELPTKPVKKSFIARLIDLIKAVIELIKNLFSK